MKKRNIKSVFWYFLVLEAIILACPSFTFARRVKVNFPIEAFLEGKDKVLNKMVKEIMASERGAKLVGDIKGVLAGYRKENGLKLPAEIKGIMIPAGHGYEYKADVTICKNDGYISFIIEGDTEPEGDSQDPSCWDRIKVIERCVITALKECGLNIRQEPITGIEDPYWFNYYYVPPYNFITQ